MSRSILVGLLALGAISCSTSAAKEPPKEGASAGNLSEPKRPTNERLRAARASRRPFRMRYRRGSTKRAKQCAPLSPVT